MGVGIGDMVVAVAAACGELAGNLPSLLMFDTHSTTFSSLQV